MPPSTGGPTVMQSVALVPSALGVLEHVTLSELTRASTQSIKSKFDRELSVLNDTKREIVSIVVARSVLTD